MYQPEPYEQSEVAEEPPAQADRDFDAVWGSGSAADRRKQEALREETLAARRRRFIERMDRRDGRPGNRGTPE